MALNARMIGTGLTHTFDRGESANGIGHCMTTKGWMRRAEEEYYATVWAIDKCHEYGIEVPSKIIEIYQEYINNEIDRGIRRGGQNYGNLILQEGRG